MDVQRGRWNYDERETRIKDTSRDDGKEVKVHVEQEPGSGGKESAQRTVRGLAGVFAAADRVTGDKITRAEPWAGMVQGGHVLLLAGPWNQAYLDEHEFFPNGPFKDQVDASSGAFAKLTDVGGKKAGPLW
jgi:predicted phage terminase large subunit-like protein